MSVSRLTSFPIPSESRVRFLILDISLGCGFNELNVMNGLMHDAFWKSHDFGPGDVKLLQVDQLTDAFGQRPQAHPVGTAPAEIKLCERPHVADALREFLQLHTATEVEICEVDKLLSESFGEQEVKIVNFGHTMDELKCDGLMQNLQEAPPT